ncbi:MAG: TRAP transporter large permease [Cyclobacteriaceae bacterium]
MALTEILILSFSFLLLIALGVPIAASIGLSSVLTLMMSLPTLPAFTTLAQRMATGLDSFALLAIPFFILSGQLMNRGGIASRLIDFAKVFVGGLPGGLAFVNIIACLLFGSISGSAAAAASAIGGFMGPKMKEEGYDEGFSAAVNITSSTNGLIVPPSNILIVYSLASGGVSIAALFLAGYGPGLLLAFLLMILSAIIAVKKKYKKGSWFTLSQGIRKMIIALPSLFMLVVVIGGIVVGIFTATEASAVAVLYTLILALIYGEIDKKDFKIVILETVKMTSIIMLLVGTSIGMSWVMAFENIPQNVTNALIGLSDNPVIILLIINLILLVVGVFMDMTPAVLIFTPIFLPVVTELGVDPIHFGIVMVINLCVGLCTPPVGALLFIGCSVAKINVTQVLRPMIPFFAVMLTVLFLVTYVPEISLWIVDYFMSE